MAALIAALPVASAEQPQVAAAPVPEQIAAAKKVFVSNAGADAAATLSLKEIGDSNRAYSLLYAGVKNWGRFELARAPSDADLVLEIGYSSPLASCVPIPGFDQQLNLTILDGSTHFILWALNQGIEGANRKATWEKNLAQAIDNLIAGLKALVTQPPAASGGHKPRLRSAAFYEHDSGR